MQNFKNLLLLSIFSSIFILSNCGEDNEDPAADQTINNGNAEGDSTIVLDLDGDGVLDTDDACSDTPSGEVVDDNGCPITDTVTETSLQQENFSEFSISLSGSPHPLAGIANGAYTKPHSPYGMAPFIDFVVNTDNTIDVLWRDVSNNKFISKISLETKSLVEEINIPTKINNQQRFLGFESLGNDRYIIGYSKDNEFGDVDAEAWYTAFDKTGTELFSTRLWGEEKQTNAWSKGQPSEAGSALIRYSEENDFIVIYLAHTMPWDDDGYRHQAGWLGFLDGNTGEILENTSRTNRIGLTRDWFFSHNFDQRGIISSQNTFYSLSHGDTYPRALGIDVWSHINGHEYGFDYYEIKNGSLGANKTLTTTGDLTELSNGNVAIVYSTEDDRQARDLKISVIDMNEPKIEHEVWLTSLDQQYVGWGSKVIQYDEEHILVGWNTFDNNQGTGSHFILTRLDGTLTTEAYSLEKSVLYPAQSFKKSADGKSIIFVSEEDGELKVHVIDIN